MHIYVRTKTRQTTLKKLKNQSKLLLKLDLSNIKREKNNLLILKIKLII